MSQRSRGLAGRVAAAAAVALAVLASGDGARGDYDETEERLKLAGVAEDVRARIHKSIDDGVKFLLARQAKDGAFRDTASDGGSAQIIDGQTALASLALAHAGGARARAAAELGLAYLLPDGEPRTAVVGFTYDAGLTAMLVAALHGDASAARRIGWAVAAGCNPRCDWWGYVLCDGATREPAIAAEPDDENISTTQFAALGLWAAGRAGGAEYAVTWRRHLVSLCASQLANGSWPYMAARPSATPDGYPNATCMGLANLTLAVAALADELPDDPVLAARAEIARRRAREALDRDASAILGVGIGAGAPKSSIEFYGLYALEKACVFADVDRVGGRPWYLVGAGRLIASQSKDGGWGAAAPMPIVGRARPGDASTVVDTSFALLFLLRASETFRPVSPRDTENRAVTPGSVPPRDAGPAAKPAPSAPAVPTTAESANAALDRLDALVRDRRATPADLVRALDDVEDARRGLGDAADDAWRGREEKLVLSAFDGAIRPTSPRRNADVAIRAAKELGGARQRVATSMRSALADALRRDDVRPPSRAVLGAAFAALARLGGEASFGWLVARVTDSTRAPDVRAARAALGALATIEGGATDRVQAVARILHVLGPIEAAAAPGGETDEFRSLVAHALTDSLGAAGLAALEHLCADARTGEPAAGPDGAPLLTFAAYARWFSRHRDAAGAPWK